MDKETAMIRAALAVLLDRAGGETTYSEAEYQAIRARRGEYAIQAEVDRSGPGDPLIRVSILPTNTKARMPVA